MSDTAPDYGDHDFSLYELLEKYRALNDNQKQLIQTKVDELFKKMIEEKEEK